MRNLYAALIFAAATLSLVPVHAFMQGNNDVEFVQNPQTSRPDLITNISTRNIVAGSGVTVVANSTGVTISATGGGGGGSSLAVDDEGVQISSPTGTLNFVGAGVTVTLQGSSSATVTIPGGGSGGGYAVQPATVTFLLDKGARISTFNVTSLSPGVMHIVTGSSNATTGLVSLSTEVTGTLPDGNLSVNVSLLGSQIDISGETNATASNGVVLTDDAFSVDWSSAISRSDTAAAYQPLDATLTDLAAAPLGEDNSISVGAVAAGTLPTDVMASSAAAALFYSADPVRTALGLAIGTNVQAFDATLSDLATVPLTEDNSIDPGAVAAGTLSTDVMASSAALVLFYSDNSVRTNLGLAIGTNVQAFDADLTDLADGSLTGSKVGDGVPAANIAAGTLDSDVMASSNTRNITSGQMANSDHGDVSWTSGVATVDNVAAPNVAAGVLGTSVRASSFPATGAIAATYGSATQVATFTVNAQGLITQVGNITITGGAGDVVTTGTQTLSGFNTFSGSMTITNGSLQIPSRANPALNLVGQFAVDTSSNQVVVHDGNNVVVFSATDTKGINIETPAVGDFFYLYSPIADITATRLICVSSASTSATIQLEECNSSGASCVAINTAAACGTTRTEIALTDTSIAADNVIRVRVTAVSGTPVVTFAQLYFSETRK